MTTLWSAWTPDVAIDVPGAPALSIDRAVKLTVIDFLERTHWLRRTTAPIDITGGAAERTFPSSIAASGERVLKIVGAWIDAEPIGVVGPDAVNEDWPDWQTKLGSPEYIVRERDDSYYVVPSPSATMVTALRLQVAIGYLETATGCDDSIRIEWRDAIAAGAKSRLMLIPEKPWTEPTLAAVQGGIYASGVHSALLRTIRTPARQALKTKAYFF